MHFDFDLPGLIKQFGYPLVWGIVFAESGLLIGCLLPGDSLLFVAGFLCSIPDKTGLYQGDGFWLFCGCCIG
jgi:membrane protein DedA with SNARE-associated domain